MNVNCVVLTGRAGKDPEVKVLEDTTLTKISMAVRNPSSKSTPYWFNLEMWGKTAEIARDYLQSGSLFSVNGTLSLNTWTDATTGKQRSAPVIKVDRLELLGSKRNEED
jgi:single-strand DNA-binding protein